MYTLRRYRQAIIKLLFSPLTSWLITFGVACFGGLTALSSYKFAYNLVNTGKIGYIKPRAGTCNDNDHACLTHYSALGYVFIAVVMTCGICLITAFIIGGVWWSTHDMKHGKKFQETVCGEFLIIVCAILSAFIIIVIGGFINSAIGIVGLISPTENYANRVTIGAVLFIGELIFIIVTALILWSFIKAARETYRSVRDEVNIITNSNR